MTKTKKFIAKRKFPHAGRLYQAGEVVELTPRQAKYLRLGGFVEENKPAAKKSEPKPAAKKKEG